MAHQGGEQPQSRDAVNSKAFAVHPTVDGSPFGRGIYAKPACERSEILPTCQNLTYFTRIAHINDCLCKLACKTGNVHPDLAGEIATCQGQNLFAIRQFRRTRADGFHRVGQFRLQRTGSVG
jgi:hypothetical protein